LQKSQPPALSRALRMIAEDSQYCATGTQQGEVKDWPGF
jgi:hypothetical protein